MYKRCSPPVYANRCCRLGNQRIMELEATVEDLREAQTSTASDASGGSSARLLNTLNEQVRRSQKLASDLDEKRNRVDELEPELAAQRKVVTSLEKQLADKQRDMAAMEDKYKGYLEKAKMVSDRTATAVKVTGAAVMLDLLFRR